MNHQMNCERIDFWALIEALNTCRFDPRWRGRWIIYDDWLTIIQNATGPFYKECSRSTLNITDSCQWRTKETKID